MVMTMTKTIITKIIIIRMMRMRTKIGNHIKTKTFKQNKKCSMKNNSYLLKREKRSESHLLLECKNHIM